MEGQNISGDSVLTREKLYSGQQNKNSSDIPEIDYFSFGVCDIIIWLSSLGFIGTGTFCFRWSTTNGGRWEPKGVQNQTETDPRPPPWTWSTSAESSWSCSVAWSLPSWCPSQSSASNSGETPTFIPPSSGKTPRRNWRLGHHLCGNRSCPHCYQCSEGMTPTPRIRPTARVASLWPRMVTGWGICEDTIWKDKSKLSSIKCRHSFDYNKSK